MSRTRTERLQSALLGRDTGHIRCPRVRRLALSFDPGLDPSDPVELMYGHLRALGLSTPEALREIHPHPPGPLLAAPLSPEIPGLDVRSAAPGEVLAQALLLGLCTRHLYDPARPVLWTYASLTRRLELFDAAGFYA